MKSFISFFFFLNSHTLCCFIQMEKSIQPLRPYERHDTLKQFLDHNGKILRFYCFWDDTENVFGVLHELILHYFLADDTIEINEVIHPNSGQDTAPKFLRRSRLPKVIWEG